MCDPATMMIGSMVMSVARGAMSFMGQSAAANAQAAANQRQAAEINRATIANYDAIAAREIEEMEAASQQQTLNSRDALRARARARVSAGESGVAIQSNSVQGLLREFYFAEGEFNRTTENNLEGFRSQSIRERERIRSGAQSQLNSLPTPERPSFLGAALRVGGSMFGAYQRYKAPDPGSYSVPGGRSTTY